MNKNEKNYLFDRCKEYYFQAMEMRIKNYYMFVVYLSKARELKTLIEKFIDCQASEYYQKYQIIVSLENDIIYK